MTPSAARECLRMIVPMLAVWIVLICLQTSWAMWLACLLSIVIFFTIYFFRDPDREVPPDEKIVVAAADGTVVGIEELEEPHFRLGKMKRVAIFLSVFDVHVNRMPVTGTVRRTVHTPGQFLDVRHPDASLKNEHQSWLIDSSFGPVVVRQIAGLIARRIVPWAHERQTLGRGQRFGMIRFGSRTEVYLPTSCEVLVKIGDKVRGASSPIARFP